MTERLDNIETMLAHQERQIQEMSDMINTQWQEIERLKRHITKTEAKLHDYIDTARTDVGLSSAEIAARDKPPHY